MACVLTAAAVAEEEARVSGDYRYLLRPDGTAEIVGYSGEETAIRIPEMLDGHWVTALGDRAFAEAACSSVSIPLSVTEVGVNPFYNCEELLSIDVAEGHPTLATADLVLFSLPDRRLVSYPAGLQLTSYALPSGLREIGADAFAWCAFLESVRLCDTLEIVGDGAFNMCASLSAVTLPNSVRTLGESAFASSGLRQVTLPAGLEALPDRVFYGCGELNALSLPATVREIGDEALGFTMIEALSIPAGVESIGINPFVGCDELIRLEVDGANPRFRMDGPLLIEPETGRVITCLTRTVGALRVPEGIAEIGDWALYGCSELTEIALPGSLRRIGAGGLNACMACLSLELPEGLTELGDLALADCFLLERVMLPASLTQLGEGVLEGCEALTAVIVTPGSAAEQYGRTNGLPVTASP